MGEESILPAPPSLASSRQGGGHQVRLAVRARSVSSERTGTRSGASNSSRFLAAGLGIRESGARARVASLGIGPRFQPLIQRPPQTEEFGPAIPEFQFGGSIHTSKHSIR